MRKHQQYSEENQNSNVKLVLNQHQPTGQYYHHQNVSENLIKKKQESQNTQQGQSLDEDIEISVDQLSGDEGIQDDFSAKNTNSQKQKPKANTTYTIFTVMNCTIGTGVLAMPYTVYTLGWLFSFISFVTIGLVNQYSIVILLKIKNLTKHSNYSTISSYVLKGKFLCIFVSSLICVGNFGFCVALFSIMKGTGRKMMEDFIKDQEILQDFYTSEWFIVLITGFLSFPTVLVKRIQSLRHTAFVGVLGIVIALIAYVIIFFVQMSQREWKNSFQMRAFPQSGLNTLAVIPNIGLALVFQMNFFSIYKGMKNPTDKRTNFATSMGTASSALIYFTLGLMGYCLFGAQETPNFLINIKYGEVNTVLYMMVYIGILLTVIFSVPVNAMVVRNNLLSIIKEVSQQKIQKQIAINQDDSEETGSMSNVSAQKQRMLKATRTFYLVTVSIHILTILIAILVQSLQSVFNFVGAISSTSIGFIIPFAFYYILILKKNKKKNIHYYASIAGMIVFIPFGIIAVISLYI